MLVISRACERPWKSLGFAPRNEEHLRTLGGCHVTSQEHWSAYCKTEARWPPCQWDRSNPVSRQQDAGGGYQFNETGTRSNEMRRKHAAAVTAQLSVGKGAGGKQCQTAERVDTAGGPARTQEGEVHPATATLLTTDAICLAATHLLSHLGEAAVPRGSRFNAMIHYHVTTVHSGKTIELHWTRRRWSAVLSAHASPPPPAVSSTSYSYSYSYLICLCIFIICCSLYFSLFTSG